MDSQDTNESLVKAAQDGDKEALGRLFQENEPFIWYFVRKYYHDYNQFDDGFSLGSLAFVKAALQYNPEHGVRFTTYAAQAILNEFRMESRRNKKRAKLVTIPLEIIN